MIAEHDSVILVNPVPSEGLESGDLGTVVHVYKDGAAYEVEFVTLDGTTTAVLTLEASDVRPISVDEMPNARKMTSKP